MLRRLLPFAILLHATVALAQGPPSGTSIVVGPGMLVREKAYVGAEPEIIPIPWIDARFGRWTIRGLGAEYALGESRGVRFSAIANFRLGGVEPADLEPRLELFDRDPTVELGVGASLPLGSWQLGAEASADVLGRHGGFDASLRLGKMIRAGRMILVPAAGLRYWSADLAAYDYGLAPGEAGFASGYEPGGAVIPELSVAGGYMINPKWSVIGFGRVLRLDDGIVASPIVDSRTEAMVGIGLGYRLR